MRLAESIFPPYGRVQTPASIKYPVIKYPAWIVLACALLFAGSSGGAVAAGSVAAHAAGAWRWPVSGDILTPYRNGDDPYASGQHRGLDIAAPVGTRVIAVAAGSVAFAGKLPDGGNCVTLLHADGSHLVSYLHLSSIAVQRGGAVGAGTTIGRAGTTGKRSTTEPHLHLGVRLRSSNAYVDPLPLLGPRPVTQVPADHGAGQTMPLASKPPAAVGAPHAESESLRRRRARTEAHSRSRSNARTDARARAKARSERNRTRAPRAHVVEPGRRNRRAPSSDRGSIPRSGRSHDGGASRRRTAPPPLPRIAPPPSTARTQTLTAGQKRQEPAGGKTGVSPVNVPAHAATRAGASGDGDHWRLYLLGSAICAIAAFALWRRPASTVGGSSDEPSGGPSVELRDGMSGGPLDVAAATGPPRADQACGEPRGASFQGVYPLTVGNSARGSN